MSNNIITLNDWDKYYAIDNYFWSHHYWYIKLIEWEKWWEDYNFSKIEKSKRQILNWEQFKNIIS